MTSGLLFGSRVSVLPPFDLDLVCFFTVNPVSCCRSPCDHNSPKTHANGPKKWVTLIPALCRMLYPMTEFYGRSLTTHVVTRSFTMFPVCLFVLSYILNTWIPPPDNLSILPHAQKKKPLRIRCSKED